MPYTSGTRLNSFGGIALYTRSMKERMRDTYFVFAGKDNHGVSKSAIAFRHRAGLIDHLIMTPLLIAGFAIVVASALIIFLFVTLWRLNNRVLAIAKKSALLAIPIVAYEILLLSTTIASIAIGVILAGSGWGALMVYRHVVAPLLSVVATGLVLPIVGIVHLFKRNANRPVAPTPPLNATTVHTLIRRLAHDPVIDASYAYDLNPTQARLNAIEAEAKRLNIEDYKTIDVPKDLCDCLPYGTIMHEPITLFPTSSNPCTFDRAIIIHSYNTNTRTEGNGRGVHLCPVSQRAYTRITLLQPTTPSDAAIKVKIEEFVSRIEREFAARRDNHNQARQDDVRANPSMPKTAPRLQSSQQPINDASRASTATATPTPAPTISDAQAAARDRLDFIRQRRVAVFAPRLANPTQDQEAPRNAGRNSAITADNLWMTVHKVK